MRKIKHFVIFITIALTISCRERHVQVTKIEGREINITDSLLTIDSIDSYVKPYREHISSELEAPICYAKYDMSMTDGELNSSLGNLVADIVYEQTNIVYKERTGKDLDMVLLNYGGIRSPISKGAVSTRDAYEIMPFENTIVILEMKPEKIREMISYLSASKKAHPLHGFKLILNSDFTVKDFTIQGKPMDDNKTYFIATSNYLANLGDNMTFFEHPVSTMETDYLLRNELIDYFIKVDTLNSRVDDRFTKIQ